MKSREQKQKDLEALTEQLSKSKSAVVVSFTKLTVNKDQEIRRGIREAGASYQVVKNTLARIAVKGTQYEEVTEHFKGVSAIAWTNEEPVELAKAVSKFIKENKDNFTFKTGVVEGKVVDFDKINEIGDLPSKDELIGKLLYLLNAPAQRLATVLSAIPRDLAVVLQQVSEGKGDVKTDAKEETKSEETPEAKAEEPKAEEVKSEEKPVEEPTAEKAKEPAQETEAKAEAPEESAEKVDEPKAEADATPEAESQEKASDDQEEKSE